jgi:hypothetical protein
MTLNTEMGFYCYRNCPSCGWDATLLQITPDRWECEKCGYFEQRVHVETEPEIDWSWLPWRGIEEVARLMTKMEGANGGKHESGAWRKQGISYHLDHLWGHFVEYGYANDEALDLESGFSHAIHQAARALFIADIIAREAKG